jgi:LysR family transcriptional regulator, transcriptional activator of nhaA
MINYKHLRYFWMVAKEGGVVRASERLHLTPQTISGQVSLLEEQFGEALFIKSGRQLELTDAGRLALSYADEIFTLGAELDSAMRSLPSERPVTFKVGVADVVPKSIASRLLQPVLQMGEPVRLVCKENSIDNLLGELAVHRIDLVIADGPIPAGLNVTGYNHHLGESGVSFVATSDLARTIGSNFPACLDGAPLLIPSDTNVVQSRLLHWFDSLHIKPRILGEFDDSALMKAFGQTGTGIYMIPTAIADEISEQHDVELIGNTEEVREQFYAISTERRISHPAVAAITNAAREWLS